MTFESGDKSVRAQSGASHDLGPSRTEERRSTIVITASFTVDPLLTGLQFWLVGLLLLFFVVLRFLPRLQVVTASGKEKHSIAQSASAAWNSPHLRTIGMIIFVVGVATGAAIGELEGD